MPIASNEDSELLMRIRMEFLEMPGMRLTRSQARRLWNLNQTACDHVLDTLVVSDACPFFTETCIAELAVRQSSHATRRRVAVRSRHRHRPVGRVRNGGPASHGHAAAAADAHVFSRDLAAVGAGGSAHRLRGAV